MTEETEKQLTVAEVAEYFGVTSRAIRYWIAQGYFPNAYRISPSPRSAHKIPMSDIKAFDERRRKQG